MKFTTSGDPVPAFETELDDLAATLAPPELAGFLQEELGQRIAARLVGLSDAKQIGRYTRDNGPSPRPTVEMRLREGYKLIGTIRAAFDRKVARSWVTGTNSRLGDRAPVDVFGVAETPAEFVRVRAVARSFVVSESTVRDPLADIEAVNAARARPMSERLELALSWNLVASELRAGLIEQDEAR